jgi:ribosomal protein S18 acetylase RimI-like enzyme
MEICEAHSSEYLPAIRALFIEYAHSIRIDLCFQSFERELAELPGRYAPPDGRLLLALDGGIGAGCGALRKIGDGICEMKRLYVRPAFRGQSLGRKLVKELVAAARGIGYEWMRLDTLRFMKQAIALYESVGFQRIEPYYQNPSDSPIFMELRLR